jgi:plastocyanin
MKYLYIIAAVAVIAGGYLFVNSLDQEEKKEVQNTQEVPEGYHKMPDGTLMRNNAGTEGMGALSELQMQMSAGDAPAEEVMDDSVAQVFDIKGTNYEFDVKEIRVKKGDVVMINFESADGFHDWVVDEFNARTNKVQPGTKTTTTFTADKAGTFEYYCSVGSHRSHGMVGKLIVE